MVTASAAPMICPHSQQKWWRASTVQVRVEREPVSLPRALTVALYEGPSSRRGERAPRRFTEGEEGAGTIVRDTWVWRVSRPGVRGGFVGRSRRPRAGSDDPPDKLAAALVAIGAGRTLVEAEQVHAGEVAHVTAQMLAGARDDGRGLPVRGVLELPGVDALVTDAPGPVLAIYVADCLALWLHDPRRGVIGLAHAGWRGLAAEIPAHLVHAALSYGGAVEELRVALSPSIRRCCFEVGEEVAAVFADVPGAVDRSRAQPHVDLLAVAQQQLREAGVPEGRIEVVPGCTRCDPERFASYRHDPQNCGRNVALIALASD